MDFGLFRYQTREGHTRLIWAFVMVLSWSRAIYVEFIRRADVGSFIRCHVNAFRHFGGVPLRCLYDNAKVVVVGRDAGGRPVFNTRFLDFSLRVGSDITLCRPRRAQTKGRVERAIKYIRDNFWSTARFTDLDDLNRKALEWVASVADVRLHGTTNLLSELRGWVNSNPAPVGQFSAGLDTVEKRSLPPLSQERHAAVRGQRSGTSGRQGLVLAHRIPFGNQQRGPMRRGR